MQADQRRECFLNHPDKAVVRQSRSSLGQRRHVVDDIAE
jgi:hypothetical protein